MKVLKEKANRLILTLGDPNGIGPEILLKIFGDSQITNNFSLKIAGSKRILDFYSGLLCLPEISKDKIIEIPVHNKYEINPGKIEKYSGKISGDSIREATALCIKNKFDAMITLPVSKEALNLGGFHYPGHTEMLAALTGSDDVVMIMYSQKFSVALMTGHIPLKDVNKKISKGLLIRKIITVNNALVKNFNIRNPKIAVLSLNPHSGDGGLLGQEELRTIIPVINSMNNAGFNLRGPYSPDAFFAGKTYKRFDITIAMYHDQALIPFKMISFEDGVNFTAGLKIIRTSPDHGTAFDIAGTGKASSESTLQAIKLADIIAGSNIRLEQ